MKIALFGATGNTGLQLVAQAVQRGHTVSALVRNTGKLATFAGNENFKVIQCDILNPKEIAAHLQGHDCVVSALGVAGVRFSAITFYQDSIKSIVSAMREANIKRLVCITSQYAKPDPNYPLWIKLFLRPLIGRQLDSMLVMEEFLFKECDDIDYTIVRPPGLTDNPLANKDVATKENEYHFGNVATTHQMPRADVAQFMLNELEKNQYIKKGVSIDFLK